jgi:Holliday junction resolvase
MTNAPSPPAPPPSRRPSAATAVGRAMKGGRASRQKGNRLERAIVRLLQDHGLGAERVPLSGSAGGSFSGDVTTPLIGRDLTIECKSRANGFLKLYTWLEGRDALIIKADRRDALVVLPLRLAVEIASAAERRKP